MDNSDISVTKDRLRRTMRDRLGSTTETQRAAWSQSILHWLTRDSSWVDGGTVVALFAGLKSEPNLLPLIAWLRERGAQAAFFAIEEEVMTPYVVSGEDDLVKATLGVLEPKRTLGRRINVADLSAVLVPGLAFGKNDGSRLGRGKGHYDRVLGAMSPQASTVGVGFDLQLLLEVPCEEHDVRLRALVSESGWVKKD